MITETNGATLDLTSTINYSTGIKLEFNRLKFIFKKHWMIIILTFVFIIISILIVYYWTNDKLINTLIAADISVFGLIFAGLKFELDRAQFERDLFDKRYEIFNIVNDVLWKWASSKNYPLEAEELDNKLSGSIINKSYFLFSDKTYHSLKKIREDLIKTNDARKESPTKRITDIEIKKLEEYLGKLVYGENLFKLFPELKVSF